MRRTQRLVTVVGAIVAPAITAMGAVPAAPESPDPPAFCTQSGFVPASSLKGGISTDSCDIVGRTVVSDGIGVKVPKPGHTNGAAALKAHGSQTLRVTNTSGRISVLTSSARPSRATPRTRKVRPGALEPQCRDDTFQSRPDTVANVFEWRYNRGTTPARLAPSAALAAIRAANTNITDGHNSCPNFDGNPAATGSYQGNTNKKADVQVTDNTVVCGAEDNTNVVDWGNVGDFLAYTCYWVDGTTTTGADFSLDPDDRIYTEVPTKCESEPSVYEAYDLQGLATHEWGHVFGLSHVDEAEHPYLTMSPILPSCSPSPRSLGAGDWLGMIVQYGLE